MEDKNSRFSHTIFKNVIARLEETMGDGTIRAVFRLVGKDLGKSAAKRITSNHSISQCSLCEFAKIFMNEVIAPVTGSDGVAIKNSSSDEVELEILTCPFEKMGFDISHKFYCTYTEGLIERVFEEKLGKGPSIKIKSLKSDGGDKCSFLISK
ncbi:MAG: methanogen output domain 1-containing protein [Candidatus Jordarchaeaceae archaeon]